MNLTFLNCYGQFVSFLHLDHPNTVSRIHVFERKINCYETTFPSFQNNISAKLKNFQIIEKIKPKIFAIFLYSKMSLMIP